MIEAFASLDALVAPLDRANVDTDAIIPKQFLKSVRRTGFGPNLFDEWRYLDRGEPGQDVAARQPNPDFVLNEARYLGAQILLTRDNFGCGSSREHAVWALRDFGIRALIAPRFADIFRDNCYKNGLLPLELAPALIDRFFEEVAAQPTCRMRIDLASQSIQTSGGVEVHFDIEPLRKRCLLEGLDDIALTLARTDRIQAYEVQRRALEPWLFS